jgi:hypothetical protein
VIAGQAIVAPLVRRDDWITKMALTTPLPRHAAEGLAAAWLEDAQMEHASIASFARFAMELLALGAPPGLLVAAQRAGLDEIAHARTCFGVAQALSGEAWGPGALPASGLEPRGLFDALAAAVHEGCVGEALAAGLAREQARRATTPSLARALERIAEDESSHAALAYEFVAWAIAVHGEAARRVVANAFQEAASRPPAAPAAPELDPELMHAGGRLTKAEWQRATSELLRDVVGPAAKALLSSRNAA